MNRTDAPKKQPVPFGVNGSREDLLPTTPAGDNQASYDAGFPPVTMILKAAGGLPPKGQNMNQILYELSAIGRWLMAGAINSYDAAFSTAIGGYPMGCEVLGDDGETIYFNTTESNTTNPNSGGAGWVVQNGDYQPLNANLTALSGLAGAANRLPYFTGAGAMANTTLTAAGRELISKADVAAILTYLGLGDGKFVSASGGEYDETFKFGRLEILPKESNAAALYNSVGSSADGSIVAGVSLQWYANRFDVGITRDAATGTRGLSITYNGNTVAVINQYGDVMAVRGLFESGGTVRAYSPNNPPPGPQGVRLGARTQLSPNTLYDGFVVVDYQASSGVTGMGGRPLQTLVGGNWVTVGVV